MELCHIISRFKNNNKKIVLSKNHPHPVRLLIIQQQALAVAFKVLLEVVVLPHMIQMIK
jgi:hypothetical protein